LAPADSRSPAVIVLHTSDNARPEFIRLAAMLHDEGYTVLSLDGR
jgi:dienelactone hydrolase